MKLKILDLFSGLGGFSLGLERTGHFETVAFCDNDKYSNLLLQKHWKGVKIYNDVKELKGEEIIKEHGTIDIVVGGFPCQPFSIAGARKGTDDNRHLWPEMFRIIKELKPRWVIGENVKGLVNLQNGLVFETVCTDLEGEGYEVRAFNIPAAGVGAPHRRERIWIVANSRRTLRQGTELREKNEDETRKENADQHQRSNSPSKSNVANANSERQQEQCRTESVQKEGNEPQRSSSQARHAGWESEPDVGRVANGIPGRVHRLKALGNSIVPKIAEEIGRAIMKAENEVE